MMKLMKHFVSADQATDREQGWRSHRTDPSLPEVHRSVKIPQVGRNWFGMLLRLLAFSGPGYLIALAYMHPPNWATDIARGSPYSSTPPLTQPPPPLSPHTLHRLT